MSDTSDTRHEIMDELVQIWALLAADDYHLLDAVPSEQLERSRPFRRYQRKRNHGLWEPAIRWRRKVLATIGLVTVAVMIRRLTRQTRQVRDENERDSSKIVLHSPPARNKGLKAILDDPALMLSAISTIFTIISTVVAILALLVACSQRPGPARLRILVAGLAY